MTARLSRLVANFRRAGAAALLSLAFGPFVLGPQTAQASVLHIDIDTGPFLLEQAGNGPSAHLPHILPGLDFWIRLDLTDNFGSTNFSYLEYWFNGTRAPIWDGNGINGVPISTSLLSAFLISGPAYLLLSHHDGSAGFQLLLHDEATAYGPVTIFATDSHPATMTIGSARFRAASAPQITASLAPVPLPAAAVLLLAALAALGLAGRTASTRRMRARAA
jgi:hypothetical protein